MRDSDRDLVMVLQVLPHTRQIGTDGDVVTREFVSRADAGEHHELRRHVSAGRQNHFGIRVKGENGNSNKSL